MNIIAENKSAVAGIRRRFVEEEFEVALGWKKQFAHPEKFVNERIEKV
ncbi:hypothetical protein QUF75_02960 [Desulfococcaceae bacterium HSG7]|nr:hypothetical protein [Desulfococcaceae bacterium HSG7]